MTVETIQIISSIHKKTLVEVDQTFSQIGLSYYYYYSTLCCLKAPHRVGQTGHTPVPHKTLCRDRMCQQRARIVGNVGQLA